MRLIEVFFGVLGVLILLTRCISNKVTILPGSGIYAPENSVIIFAEVEGLTPYSSQSVFEFFVKRVPKCYKMMYLPNLDYDLRVAGVNIPLMMQRDSIELKKLSLMTSSNVLILPRIDYALSSGGIYARNFAWQTDQRSPKREAMISLEIISLSNPSIIWRLSSKTTIGSLLIESQDGSSTSALNLISKEAAVWKSVGKSAKVVNKKILKWCVK